MAGEGANYVKIQTMKASLPHPEHESYLRHRKQNLTQVLLPVILSALLLAAFAVWLAVRGLGSGGDVSRWGAISAIWVILPLMVMALVFTALLGALVYLMARLLKILPGYTSKAHDFFYRLEGIVRRGLDASVKPVFGLAEIGATIKAIFGRK